MKHKNVQSVCSGLTEKALLDHFLDSPVEEIEVQANDYVKKYAEENGLTAHTLSAFKWYFQSDEKLLEDGFVELLCHTNLLNHKGSCKFNVVDVASIDKQKATKETTNDIG